MSASNRKKVDINQKDINGNTPLMRAIQKHRDDIVSLLIEKNANPNIKNNEGKTALFFVRYEDMCRSLIKSGADIYAQDNKGQCSFSVHMDLGNFEIAKIIFTELVNSMSSNRLQDPQYTASGGIGHILSRLEKFST